MEGRPLTVQPELSSGCSPLLGCSTSTLRAEQPSFGLGMSVCLMQAANPVK